MYKNTLNHNKTMSNDTSNETLKLLGVSTVNKRHQIKIPDSVMQKLNLTAESIVIFYDSNENNVVIMKKGKVIDYE